MSGKRKKGAGKSAPRAYGRLTRHERDTVQRMLERGASCRRIARELGRSPSTVSAEVASHRFVTAPRKRRGERVDASADLSAACPRLTAWPRCRNGCGRYRAIGCTSLLGAPEGGLPVEGVQVGEGPSREEVATHEADEPLHLALRVGAARPAQLGAEADGAHELGVADTARRAGRPHRGGRSRSSCCR